MLFLSAVKFGIDNKMRCCSLFIFFLIYSVSLCATGSPVILREEFIYEQAPFPSCHAPTLVEIEPGVIAAAWFGGSHEKCEDVEIWFSKKDNATWSSPCKIASDKEVPLWNPVLFLMPSNELLLFYKSGPCPRSWSGLLKRSTDGGESWSKEERLPAGILGPIRNKPVLDDKGVLICGSSVESWDADAVWIEMTPDGGRTWKKYGPVTFPNSSHGVIQPALFYDKERNLNFLCRPRKGLRRICLSRSKDGGKNWSPLEITHLPNPDAAIDALSLHDGKILLVYNHCSEKRERLDLAVFSEETGEWRHLLNLEEGVGEFSYPAMIQDSYGNLHIAYTWNREKIKYLEIDAHSLSVARPKISKVLDEVTALSCETRSCKLDKFSKEEKDAASIRLSCLEKMEDFTSGDLEESVANFVSQTLQFQDARVENIKSVPGLEHVGESGDSVFFVKSLTKEPLCVVKACKVPLRLENLHKEHFTIELSSIEFMQSHPVSSVISEKALSVGRCKFKEEQYVLIAKTFCPGVMVEKLVDRLLKDPSEENIAPALDAVAKIGKTLGEIHSIARKRGVFDVSEEMRIKNLLKVALQKGGSEFSKFDLELFEAYLSDLTDKFLNSECIYRYCYRDASCANFLYEENSKQLYLVDLARLHDSVGKRGTPIGNPAKDIVQFEEKLEEFLVKGLDRILYKRIEDAFHLGYLSVARQLPEESVRKFFYVCRKLHRIDWSANYKNRPENKRQEHKILFHQAIDYFHQELSEFKDKMNREV